MRKWIGKFIFDLVVRYIWYLDDEHFDLLSERVYRPEFTRRRPLPKPGEFKLFFYKPLGSKED